MREFTKRAGEFYCNNEQVLFNPSPITFKNGVVQENIKNFITYSAFKQFLLDDFVLTEVYVMLPRASLGVLNIRDNCATRSYGTWNNWHISRSFVKRDSQGKLIGIKNERLYQAEDRHHMYMIVEIAIQEIIKEKEDLVN